jgi:hypothetical protein
MGWEVNATPRSLYPSTHCIRGWMGPSAGLNGCGKSHPTRIRSPDRPARIQSLYVLHYPGSRYHKIMKYFLLYLRWMFKRDCELPIKNNFNTLVLYYCLVRLNTRCDPNVFRQLLWNTDNFLYGHNLFLFFKIHSSLTNTFICKILRSCTCRLFSLPQVEISLKRAAFLNSGRNSVCSDKGA